MTDREILDFKQGTVDSIDVGGPGIENVFFFYLREGNRRGLFLGFTKLNEGCQLCEFFFKAPIRSQNNEVVCINLNRWLDGLETAFIGEWPGIPSQEPT